MAIKTLYFQLWNLCEVIQRIKDDMKPGYKVKLNLNSAKGKEPFYEKFGFKIRPNEECGAGMDQWLNLE